MQRLILAQRAAAPGFSFRPGVQAWRFHRSQALHSVATAASNKHKVVFLGTPEVAANVLRELLDAAKNPTATFEIAAVVSQPGKPKGRGNKKIPIPSPVEQLARESGVADEQILCPASAKDEAFLSALTAMQPDLCITAAYGNMLPTRFLEIPRCGTLNIHPSLLPQFRGAAPVPRAIEAGVAETGVSVAYTVLKCDAGPVLAQERVALDPEVQAPELLEQLFSTGVKLLLSKLDSVWAGQGPEVAQAQDEAQVTHAAKMSKEESQLDFSLPAQQLHNKVRAFAGWPGTTASFTLVDEASGKTEDVEYKVVRTRVADAGAVAGSSGADAEVVLASASMYVRCGGGSVLEVLQVQPPGKKVMGVKDLKNGLGKRKLLVRPAAAQVAA